MKRQTVGIWFARRSQLYSWASSPGHRRPRFSFSNHNVKEHLSFLMLPHPETEGRNRPEGQPNRRFRRSRGKLSSIIGSLTRPQRSSTSKPEVDLFTEVVSGTPCCVVAAVASFVEAVYRGVAIACQTPFASFFKISSYHLQLTLHAEFALRHKDFGESDSGLNPAPAHMGDARRGAFSERYGTAKRKLKAIAMKMGE